VGAVFALFYGSKSFLLTLVATVTLPTASVAATWWQARRMRLIYPRRIRLFSRRVFLLTSLLGLLSLVIVLAIVGVAVAASLHWWSWAAASAHRGTPMSFLLPFVVFMAPVIAAASLPWLIDPYGIDARPMRKTPDQPAVGDPVIEPRQQTMVCAMLAGVEWIDAGFLAKTMELSEDELRRQTSELVAAHTPLTCTSITAGGGSALPRSAARPTAVICEPCSSRRVSRQPTLPTGLSNR
jgi:hypothetical protein